MPDIGYYFTGDINMTGTKVKETNDGKTGRKTTGVGWQGLLKDGNGNPIKGPKDYTKSDTGTVSDGYIDNEGSTFYRWGNSAPSRHAEKIMVTNQTIDADVYLSLPADSTVKVQSGNQIEVPLTITPNEGVLIAGFEFEVEFKESVLKFIDMKTSCFTWALVYLCNGSRSC